MRKFDLIFKVILLPIDALMIFCAFLIAYKLRANWDIIPTVGPLWKFSDYIIFCLKLLPVWLVIFALEGLYNIRRSRRGFSEVMGILLATAAGTTVIVIWIFFGKIAFFSRLIVLYIWIASLILVFISRQLIYSFQRILNYFDVGTKQVIFIGFDNQVDYLVKSIKKNKFSPYKIIGYLNHADHHKSVIKYLGHYDELQKIIDSKHIDEVILNDTNISAEKAAEILAICKENRISFKYIPNAFDMKSTNIYATTLENVPIIEYNHTSLEGWGKVAKRIVDIIGSLILIIILSPVFVIIAILVKIDSKGPVFFVQKRLGNHNKFNFIKFRSMRIGAEKEHDEYIKKYGNMFKLANDPRITKFGRFIRRTSIDELPQLFNVFTGSMSLVGPRPPMPEEAAHYTRFQKQRLAIKPGITGLWQVSGRSNLTFEEWVQLDLFYIENWSLWLDLKILSKTLSAVINRDGAY